MEALESVIENLPITNSSEPVVVAQKSFAVSVQEVNMDEFKRFGQTFSVNFGDLSITNQSLNLDDLTFGTANQQSTAAISLPNNLLSATPSTINSTRITHSVFITDSLFLRRSQKFLEVESLILSASVVGRKAITELDPPVNLRFLINPVSVTVLNYYLLYYRIQMVHFHNVLSGVSHWIVSSLSCILRTVMYEIQIKMDNYKMIPAICSSNFYWKCSELFYIYKKLYRWIWRLVK